MAEACCTRIHPTGETYEVNSNQGSAALSQSVFETNQQYFSQNDLTAFQSEYGLTQQEAVVQNGFESDDCTNNDCTEGNLDIQYIMGIAQQTVSIYWYQDGSVADPFVLWITDVADDANPPQSNSISWGVAEAYESAAYMNSFNTEAIKLSAQGVTIVVSSGDSGAPNLYTDTCLCSGVTANSITSNGYNPSFPATSPYVTAVGGTMGPENGDDEVVCDANSGGVITSGGGFSTQFAAPTWQTDAIAEYFASLSSPPVSGYSTTGRGYPDISLVAVRYPVMIAGTLQSLYGTSAAAPVFAGFVSLVNAARLAANLSSIGFLNPTLYAYGLNASSPLRFNDVASGNNKCCSASTGPICCTTGFEAAPGWDPTTGWGSVNFDTFSEMYAVAQPYYGETNDHIGSDIAALVVMIILLSGGGIIICCCVAYCCIKARSRSPAYQPRALSSAFAEPSGRSSDSEL